MSAPIYFDPLAPGRLRQLRDEALGWADKLEAHARDGAEVFLGDVLADAAREGRALADDAERQLEAFEGITTDLDTARADAHRCRSEAHAAASVIDAMKDPTRPIATPKAMLAARDAAFVASIIAARADAQLERAENARATTLREGELLRFTKGMEKGRRRAEAIALRPLEKWDPSGDPLALAGMAASRIEAREKALAEALRAWNHHTHEAVREVLTQAEPPTLAQRQRMTGIDAQHESLRVARHRLDADVRANFAAYVRGRGDAEVRKLIGMLEAAPAAVALDVAPSPTIGEVSP